MRYACEYVCTTRIQHDDIMATQRFILLTQMIEISFRRLVYAYLERGKIWPTAFYNFLPHINSLQHSQYYFSYTPVLNFFTSALKYFASFLFSPVYHRLTVSINYVTSILGIFSILFLIFCCNMFSVNIISDFFMDEIISSCLSQKLTFFSDNNFLNK